LLAAALIAVLSHDVPAAAENGVGMDQDGPTQPDAATRGVVANSSAVRLVFDRAEIEFNNLIVHPASANLKFAWSRTGAAACADGINNDDHTAVGRGRQDELIDFPADPDCVSLDDASEDKAGLQERRPVVFAGELDGEGRLIIPPSGIDIPRVWAWDESAARGGDQVYAYDFEPVGSAVGVLSPVTREMGLHLRFRIRVRVANSARFSGPGENCYVGSLAEPIAIRLTTIEARSEAGLPVARGVAYAADTGAVKLVGYNVGDVAGAAECGAFGALDNIIGAAFGVPSAPGNIRLTAVGRVQPIPPIPPIPRPADQATPSTIRSLRERFPSEEPRAADDGAGQEPQTTDGDPEAADSGVKTAEVAESGEASKSGETSESGEPAQQAEQADNAESGNQAPDTGVSPAVTP
jgi:hypothetical protein